jgi:hypothetical protein
MSLPAAEPMPPIRLALPEHAVVVEPAALPTRDEVRETLVSRFGHLEDFEARSEDLLDTLDETRHVGETAGLALFALMAYGEGDDAVTVTLKVLSVDVSTFADLHGQDGASSASASPTAGDDLAQSQRELAETGSVTTADGRVITAVKLPAGDALCVTAVHDPSREDSERDGRLPEVRIDYFVPRPGSQAAVALAFHSRWVAYAEPFGQMALRLARSLEFTAA